MNKLTEMEGVAKTKAREEKSRSVIGWYKTCPTAVLIEISWIY